MAYRRLGRSGLVVHAFGQRLMHLGFDVHLAQEITAPAIRRGDLLVACSGTGTTLLPLYMARKARKIGARVVSLTARDGSPLACPLTAFGGEADPDVTPADLRLWAERTSGPFRLHVYPGDHFFLHHGPGQALREQLARELLAAVAGSPG